MKARPPPHEAIRGDVARALAEDVGTGDLSADLVPPSRQAHAQVVAREPCILCGVPWFNETFAQVDAAIRIRWRYRDADAVAGDDVLCDLQGPARALLTAERTALNFLQTLSATATRTRRHVDALGDTTTRLLDTRKTLPGLRLAQKFAVVCGGGQNHRMGLFDAILIKENHIQAAGSIAAALQAARTRHPGVPVEVEVESLAQLDEVIREGAERALLDNFDTAGLQQAVQRAAGRLQLEASGNMRLEDLARVAATGVDFISVGALTKHIDAVDLSLRFLAQP